MRVRKGAICWPIARHEVLVHQQYRVREKPDAPPEK
jgi:hypothetical protein